MSFQTQVEDLAGALPASLSSLNDALTAGAKDIIRRVKLVSPDDLWLFTAEEAVTSSGLGVDYGLVYDVSRGSKPCKPLPVHKRHRAAESDSIEYATGEFPVYYLLNGKIFVLPDVGTGSAIDIEGFSTNDSGNKTLITLATHGFDAGDFIVISQSDPAGDQTYAGTHRVFSVPTELTIIVKQNFTVTSEEGYSAVEAEALAQYLSVPAVSASTSVIDNFPASYYELVVLYGAMVVVLRHMADLHTGLPAITLPVVSVAPQLLVPEQSLASFAPPAAYSQPVAPAGSNINYTDVPAAPAYSSPSPPVMDTLSFTENTLTIPPLVLDTSPANIIDAPDLSTDAWQADYTFVRAKVPEYTQPVYVPPAVPDIDDFPDVEEMPLLVLPVQPTVQPVQFIFADLEDLPSYTPPVPYVEPASPNSVDVDFTGVPDTPSFSRPVAPVMSALGFTDDTLTVPPLVLDPPPADILGAPDLSTDAWQADYDFARNIIPEYVKPIYTQPDFPSIDDFPDVDDMPLLVLPIQPTIQPVQFSFDDLENLPTYTRPAAYVSPATPASVDVDFTDVPGVPAYTGPVAPSLPALSFDVTDLDDITALPLSHEIPIAPESPSFSEGDVDYSTLVRAKVPEYVQPVFSPPAQPTIPSLSVPSPPAGISSASFSDPSSSGASSGQPQYVVPVLDVPDFTYIEDTLITQEEDSELASSMMQVVSGKIQKYQAELQDAVNVYNKENGIYQQLIQQELANSKITLDKENQEFQANLTRHNTEVQTYQADVNSLVQEWTKNHVEAGISFWGTKFTNYLSEYQQDISNEVNVFNKNVSEYQAEIQKATTDASNAMTRENNEYAAKLQKFNAELQQYQYRTTHDVTEWQAKVVQPTIALFTQDHTDKLQEWQGENTRLLGLYQSQSSEAQAQFDTELKVWSQEISKAFQKYQAETGLDIQKYQADVQEEAGRYQTDSERENANHKAQMEKCQIEIAQRQGAQEIETAVSTLEIQNFTAVVQATVQEFQTKTEQVNVDFQVKAAKWTKENIEHKFNKWNTEATQNLNEYQQNITNSLNSFNKEVTNYQSEIQKAMQDAQLRVDAEGKEYTLKLQKYQGEVDLYKTKTAHDVAAWQGKDVQEAVMTFQQTRAEELQEWQADNTNKINLYQGESAQAVSEFDSELKVWSQEITRAFTEHSQEATVELQKYQADVQAEVGRYQADSEKANAAHKAQVEKCQTEIAQRQVSQEIETAVTTLEMQKYTAAVQSAVQEFQTKTEQVNIDFQIKTAKWTKENIEHKIGKWNAETTHLLNEYQQDISNSLNSFNEDVSEYQAEIQKAMQDAQLQVDAGSKEYTLKLQKYQNEVDLYKTKTAHTVAEWQGGAVQEAVMTFQQTRTEDVQEWQAENTNQISIYQAETSEASAKFDAGLKEWSQEISKALQTYQAESDVDLKQYQSDVQAEGGRYQADAERAMSIHKAQIEKAQQEIAQIQSENEGNLNKFQAELTKYQAEVQAAIGEFQGKTEQAGVEYQWLTAKYQALNAQYNQGFLTQAKEKQDGN